MTMPTHLLLMRYGMKISACGITNPKYFSAGIKDVDCYRCRKTKIFKDRKKYDPRTIHNDAE